MENGELNKDEIMRKFSAIEEKEKIESIYNACKDIKGESDCETAYKIYECYLKNRVKNQ